MPYRLRLVRVTFAILGVISPRYERTSAAVWKALPLPTVTSIPSHILKDPKLDSLLSQLAQSVRQQPLSGERKASKAPFSVETLPKVLADAVRTNQLRINKDGKVQVDIEMDSIKGEEVEALQALGVTLQIWGGPNPDRSKGEVLATVPTIEALIPITTLRRLEALPFVRYVRLPSYGMHSTGSVDSQGDSILEADIARQEFNLQGNNVNVGVISSGIAGIFATGCNNCGPATANPSPITLGDLPSNITGLRNANGTLYQVNYQTSNTVMAKTFTGDLEDTADGPNGAEGTALLEIIHDLAPNANLYFANGDSPMEFEQAVQWLASFCDIVVDDQFFLAPPYDGTSAVSANTAASLNNNANPIRGYFTSAGNLAQNHYQGLYSDSGVDGTSITGEAGDLHLFAPVSNVTTDTVNLGKATFDPIVSVSPGSIVDVWLGWNDSPGASSNDYDLFLVPLSCSSSGAALPIPPCKVNGPFVASSANPQTGTQDPTEHIEWLNSTASAAVLGIVIQNLENKAQPRTFDLFIGSPGAKSSSPNHNFNTESGSVPAQSDAGGSPVSVVSVGAINQSQCLPANCIGSLELFSSQGPTQVTPLSPARMKPDITATNGVCITGAGGFGNGPASNCPPSQPTSYTPAVFYGTSAAVPHVAAIAALTLQAAPCLLASATNPLQPATARESLRSALINNAVALPGVAGLPSVGGLIPNNVEGSGLANALNSAMSMLPTATAGSSQPVVPATSLNGATFVLAVAGSDPNSCPLTTVQWTGNCVAGSAAGLHPSISCPIGVSSVYVAVSNNGVSFSKPTAVPYTVIVTDFTVSASPAAVTISGGTPAAVTVTVLPTSQGLFSNAVSLGCGPDLPPSVSCSFSVPSITPGANGATAILTILSQPTAMSLSRVNRGRLTSKLGVLWCAFATVLLILTRRPQTLKTKVGFGSAWTALFMGFSLGAIGCGTASPPPAAKTYSITLTGTSNQLQRTATVSLTVQ
jgi:hypothetical protein